MSGNLGEDEDCFLNQSSYLSPTSKAINNSHHHFELDAEVQGRRTSSSIHLQQASPTHSSRTDQIHHGLSLANSLNDSSHAITSTLEDQQIQNVSSDQHRLDISKPAASAYSNQMSSQMSSLQGLTQRIDGYQTQLVRDNRSKIPSSVMSRSTYSTYRHGQSSTMSPFRSPSSSHQQRYYQHQFEQPYFGSSQSTFHHIPQQPHSSFNTNPFRSRTDHPGEVQHQQSMLHNLQHQRPLSHFPTAAIQRSPHTTNNSQGLHCNASSTSPTVYRNINPAWAISRNPVSSSLPQHQHHQHHTHQSYQTTSHHVRPHVRSDIDLPRRHPKPHVFFAASQEFSQARIASDAERRREANRLKSLRYRQRKKQMFETLKRDSRELYSKCRSVYSELKAIADHLNGEKDEDISENQEDDDDDDAKTKLKLVLEKYQDKFQSESLPIPYQPSSQSKPTRKKPSEDVNVTRNSTNRVDSIDDDSSDQVSNGSTTTQTETPFQPTSSSRTSPLLKPLQLDADLSSSTLCLSKEAITCTKLNFEVDGDLPSLGEFESLHDEVLTSPTSSLPASPALTSPSITPNDTAATKSRISRTSSSSSSISNRGKNSSAEYRQAKKAEYEAWEKILQELKDAFKELFDLYVIMSKIARQSAAAHSADQSF